MRGRHLGITQTKQNKPEAARGGTLVSPALTAKEEERIERKREAERERQRRLLEEEAHNKEIFLSAMAQFDSSFGSYAVEKAVARGQLRKAATKRVERATRAHIEATLDLHGLKRDQAARALDLFLTDCRLKKRKCVLIIHGKGSGALREETQLFLTKDLRVASLTPAPPALGGEGALVVMCKT
jgi:DNA-nicking Smr family endonuclease